MAKIKQGPGPEDSYVMIPNSLARNPDIPNRAKAVYIFLRSHRNGWDITTERTAEALGLSKGTVVSALSDLQQFGYVLRQKVRSDDGTFAGWEYEVLSYPVTVDQKTDHGKNPTSVKTDHGKIEPHKKTNSFKKTKGEKKNTTPNEFGADFAEFWEHYPRKIGKATAEEKYTKARGEASRDDLLVSVKNFASECERAGTEKRYIPYPGTWLNQERWRDYLNYAPRKSGREKLDQMKMWMEEMIERDT